MHHGGNDDYIDKQCRKRVVCSAVGVLYTVISITILLFSVQRGINHYIDTIAESLGFLVQWGIAGCINAENVEVTVQ